MSAAEEDHPSRSRRLRGGLNTSIVDNSSAFGFSIMITASFGALSRLDGQPGIGTAVGFGLGAAATFTLLQALASSGFRRQPSAAPREVVMLGTALNVVSVGGGVGVAMLVGLVLTPNLAWPLGGFFAAGAYVLLEAAELALAGRLIARRGRASKD